MLKVSAILIIFCRHLGKRNDIVLFIHIDNFALPLDHLCRKYVLPIIHYKIKKDIGNKRINFIFFFDKWNKYIHIIISKFNVISKHCYKIEMRTQCPPPVNRLLPIK